MTKDKKPLKVIFAGAKGALFAGFDICLNDGSDLANAENIAQTVIDEGGRWRIGLSKPPVRKDEKSASLEISLGEWLFADGDGATRLAASIIQKIEGNEIGIEKLIIYGLHQIVEEENVFEAQRGLESIDREFAYEGMHIN